MTKTLTEAQAWRKIAQRLERTGDMSGLCFQINQEAQIAEMDARIQHHLMGECCITHNRAEANGVRILAALFLALEAEDESND